MFSPARGKDGSLRVTVAAFGYSYEALALDMKQKAAEPFLLTIQPGDPQGEFHHAGQEFIYMLSGQMEFTVGEENIRLGPGDSLYFDSSISHGTHIIGKRPATFLCLFLQEQASSVKTLSRHHRRKL